MNLYRIAIANITTWIKHNVKRFSATIIIKRRSMTSENGLYNGNWHCLSAVTRFAYTAAT